MSFSNAARSFMRALSASERRLLIGLGPAQRAERVTVRWPSGREQSFTNLEGKRWWRLRESEALPEVVEPKLPSKSR